MEENILINIQTFSHTSLSPDYKLFGGRLQDFNQFHILQHKFTETNCCKTFINPLIPPPTQAHPVIYRHLAIEHKQN